MLSVEEIIEYLEVEYTNASMQLELTMGKDAQAAMFYLIKSEAIKQILVDIKDTPAV